MSYDDNTFKLLGAAPVPGDTPAGDDARYENEYTTVLEEIEKMSFSSEGSETSWRNIEKNATIILSQKSKDLQICTQLAVALCHNKGLLGFFNGMQVIISFMENFWEIGWPSLKRMRGRINAISWWQESTQKFLQELLDKEICPENTVNFETQMLLLDTITELDNLFGENAPDVSSLRPLKALIERLNIEAPPVTQEAAIEEVAQEKSEEQADIHAEAPDNTQDNVAEVEQITTNVRSQEAADSKQEKTQKEDKKKAAEQKITQIEMDNDDDDDADDDVGHTEYAEQAGQNELNTDNAADILKKVQTLQNLFNENKELVALRQQHTTSMLAYASKLSKLAPELPLSWQLSRRALFHHILNLPPFNEQESNEKIKKTYIPLPDIDAHTRAIDMLKKSPGQESLISSAISLENIFLSSPLFLDVQKTIHTTLVTLGADFNAAANTVHFECAMFFQRMQGLEQYAFDDGTPFIAPETLNWLKAGMSQQKNSSAPKINLQHSESSSLNKTLDKAQKFMLNDEISEAISLLDTQKNASVANNTRVCVYQIQFLCQAGKIDTARCLATSVLKVVNKHKLDQFDPDLALFCLSAVHDAYSLNKAKHEKDLPKLCQRIAWLSPTALLN